MVFPGDTVRAQAVGAHATDRDAARRAFGRGGAARRRVQHRARRPGDGGGAPGPVESVRAVSFVGSQAVAKAIYHGAAAHGKQVGAAAGNQNSLDCSAWTAGLGLHRRGHRRLGVLQTRDSAACTSTTGTRGRGRPAFWSSWWERSERAAHRSRRPPGRGDGPPRFGRSTRTGQVVHRNRPVGRRRAHRGQARRRHCLTGAFSSVRRFSPTSIPICASRGRKFSGRC